MGSTNIHIEGWPLQTFILVTLPDSRAGCYNPSHCKHCRLTRAGIHRYSPTGSLLAFRACYYQTSTLVTLPAFQGGLLQTFVCNIAGFPGLAVANIYIGNIANFLDCLVQTFTLAALPAFQGLALQTFTLETLVEFQGGFTNIYISNIAGVPGLALTNILIGNIPGFPGLAFANSHWWHCQLPRAGSTNIHISNVASCFPGLAFTSSWRKWRTWSRSTEKTPRRTMCSR